jgi:hypothetical protein
LSTADPKPRFVDRNGILGRFSVMPHESYAGRAA